MSLTLVINFAAFTFFLSIKAGWIYFHILIAQEKGGYVQIEMPQYHRESRDSSRESKYRDSRDNSRESRSTRDRDRGRSNNPG